MHSPNQCNALICHVLQNCEEGVFVFTLDAKIFIAGDGTMKDQSFTYDKPQALIANGYTMAGYTFAGWSLTEDDAVKYADQAQVTNLAASGNVTLYAQWNASASTAYKVVFYGETLDGTGFEEIKTQDLTGKTDSTASATAIAIEGFTYDEANSNNVTSGVIVGDGSLVLKLYYTRNSYTLTLDFNGESMKQAALDENTYQNVAAH